MRFVVPAARDAPTSAAETTRRHAILHIGVQKTGSTSIQGWLHENAAALAAQGVHVPVSLGRRVHNRLLDLARRPDRADPALLDALRAELAALPAARHTLLFTSENLAAKLPDHAAVARLRALLDPFCNRYTVIVYLRRQDEFAVSVRSTEARRGDIDPEVFFGRVPFDYAALLDRWAAVFGRDAIHPRLFVRDLMPGGDVVADFLSAAGLSVPAGPVVPSQENPSLVPAAQMLLARLAGAARSRGYASLLDLPEHRRLAARLDSRHAGPGPLPARAEAAAYLDACQGSNEAVRAGWFPDRNRLFNEGVERYPDQATPRPDAAEELAVAVDLLVTLLGSDPESAPDAAARGRRGRKADRIGGAEEPPRAGKRDGRRKDKAARADRRVRQPGSPAPPPGKDPGAAGGKTS